MKLVKGLPGFLFFFFFFFFLGGGGGWGFGVLRVFGSFGFLFRVFENV